MIASNPEFSAQVDALRRIHRLTRATAHTLQSLIPQAHSTHTEAAASDAEIPALILPFPNDIVAPIVGLDTSEKIRTKLLHTLTQRVTELQQRCTTNYQNACASAPWLIRSDRNTKLRRVYQEFYEQRCRFLVDSQLPYVLEEVAKRQLQSRPVDKKTTFNHEYTPVLEKYFEYNAYPTLPDRLVLARKSMMSARQIEVWFQNHRNRAKKEGTVLKRLSSNIASKFSFDNLAAKVPHLVMPTRDRSTSVETETSDEESVDETMDVPPAPSVLSVIDSERPCYVFPARYSERATVTDPFTTDNGAFKFLPPIWARSPATTPIRSSIIDMNEFVTMFASKLDLRGAPSKTKKPSAINATKQCTDKWFSGNVTPLHPSPHPASIPTRYTPTPSRALLPIDYERPTWQSISLWRRKVHSFRLPHSFPAWTVPDELPTHKKTPGLPRRTPSTMRSCRSNTRSPRPQTPYSRSPSSSSSSSSDSRDSRSTSASSNSSMTSIESLEEAMTPPALLEQLVQDASEYSEQDLDLFGDPLCDPQPELPESFDYAQNQQDVYNDEICDNSAALSLPQFEIFNLPQLHYFDS